MDLTNVLEADKEEVKRYQRGIRELIFIVLTSKLVRKSPAEYCFHFEEYG